MQKQDFRTILIPFLAIAGAAHGQGTAISYQGQLKQHGLPISGEMDLRFELYDGELSVNSLAGPITMDGVEGPTVAVVNGLFTVELDFGSEVYRQPELWLGVAVRSPHDPSNQASYVMLSPRQRLTPVPFAMSVPGLASNAAGVEISGDVHAAGEIAASAFTSNSPLIFKVNPLNVECARFDDANCYFGLGTQAPGARLHVGGIAGVDGIMFPDGSLQTTAAGLGGGGDGFWTAAGTNIFNNNGGNVGIGRTNPTFKLDVNASNSFGARIGMQAAGGGALVVASNPGDNRVYLEGYNSTNNGSATEMLITGYAGGVLPQLTISAAKVGIGTSTPAAKLDIAASGEGAELLRFSTERPWAFRQVRTGPSAGLQLFSTSGQKKFEITANTGENVATFLADAGNSRVGIGTINPTSRLDIVGQDGLRITGYQPFLTLTDSNAGDARGRIANANGSLAFFTEASFATGVPPVTIWNSGNALQATHTGNTSTGAVYGISTTFNGNGIIGDGAVGSNAFGVWGRSASGIGGYFTGGNYALIADGRARVDILEIAGADVAEKFLSSDDNVEPGTVMEIDPDNPGQLRVAREAYSTRVAGVVSGAGDIPVGAILGNLPGHEDAPAIALSGRVWVRCDASSAAIVPGDMLTTSDTPGHAMKAADRERAYGTILGKSMTALAQGERGLVLVLVNLQ